MELEKTLEVIWYTPIQCQNTSISSASDHLAQNSFINRLFSKLDWLFLNEELQGWDIFPQCGTNQSTVGHLAFLVPEE